MTIATGRGEVYLRSTLPGLVVASWYPSSPRDPDWPGTIIEASADTSFPTEAWEAQDVGAISEWLRVSHPDWFTKES
jgi:hypothetical protein